MIVALTTSSPQVGIATICPGDQAWELVEARREIAARNASEVIVRVLDDLAPDPDAWTAIVVDAGPGSFTGVKVGMTMAKLWARSLRIPLGCIASFDLIESADSVSMVALKKGEVLVRDAAGQVTAVPVSELDQLVIRPTGYTKEGPDRTYPDVERVVLHRDLIQWIDPLKAIPSYGKAPSISQPKRPYVTWEPQP